MFLKEANQKYKKICDILMINPHFNRINITNKIIILYTGSIIRCILMISNLNKLKRKI